MIAIGTARAAGALGALAAWRPRPRHLWLVPGLTIAVAASSAAGPGLAALAVVIAAGLVPHLPTLLGSRGRRLFNVLHEPAVPLVLAAIAATGILPALATAAALAWLGHQVMDWAFGDGVRHADGRRSHTHARVPAATVVHRG